MNGLRSENSDPLFLRFVNNYNKSVDIIWITLSGQYFVFGTLKPQEFIDVNTFMKHYWLFRETQSRLPLAANNKLRFCGEENGYPPEISGVRIRYCVLISRPVVNKLRTICIDFLCTGSNSLIQCSDVKYLDIPVTLKSDIIKKIHKRNLFSHATKDEVQQCEKNLVIWRD